MKLVLDTDVLLSGLRSAGGASRLLLCGVVEGAFTPVVTVATMLEHEDVLMRSGNLAATGLSAIQVAAFLQGFLDRSDQVLVSQSSRPSIRDPSDEIFVEALVSGAAHAIVTFNRRDYLSADDGLASLRRMTVPVLSPGEALRSFAWRPTAITPFAFPPR